MGNEYGKMYQRLEREVTIQASFDPERNQYKLETVRVEGCDLMTLPRRRWYDSHQDAVAGARDHARRTGRL